MSDKCRWARANERDPLWMRSETIVVSSSGAGAAMNVHYDIQPAQSRRSGFGEPSWHA